MSDGCFFCSFREKKGEKGFKIQIFEKKLVVNWSMFYGEYNAFTEEIAIDIKYCPMCGRKLDNNE